MSRLSPVTPDTDFIDMEDAIHDAADMANAVDDLVIKLFAKKPANGTYHIHDSDGRQLLFLAGYAVEMARKVEDAFRIAHANYVEAKGDAS